MVEDPRKDQRSCRGWAIHMLFARLSHTWATAWQLHLRLQAKLQVKLCGRVGGSTDRANLQG
jgi:hypothetical protein